MTADQVKYLKEQLNKDNGEGKTTATSVFYDFDNGMAFRNNNEFVIFDDTNELIHCIAANRNTRTKDETAYCMYSAAYEQLQFTEANLTLEGLQAILDNMLSSLITEEAKTALIQWTLWGGTLLFGTGSYGLASYEGFREAFGEASIAETKELVLDYGLTAEKESTQLCSAITAFEDFMASEEICAITSGLASKIIPKTPIGQDTLCKIKPLSSSRVNRVLLTGSSRAATSRIPDIISRILFSSSFSLL